MAFKSFFYFCWKPQEESGEKLARNRKSLKEQNLDNTSDKVDVSD
jgi:hypothetical protein